MATRRIRKGTTSFNVEDQPGTAHDGFWDWYESPTWEPETVAIFDGFLKPETTYIDLGAWIGPTALLAAGVSGEVLCVEPDPVARAQLCTNVDLNPGLQPKITVYDFAVAAADGSATLSSNLGGDSESSLVRPFPGGASWTVPVVDIKAFLRSPRASNAAFIKIDIEGAEYDLIPRMGPFIKQQRPTLYLSMHPNYLYDKTSVATKFSSGARLLYRNWKMLRTLLGYRHHYVYDETVNCLRDIRRRNILRVLLPLPHRSFFLTEPCAFTDEESPPN